MLSDEAKKAVEAEIADVEKRFNECAKQRDQLLEVRRNQLSDIDQRLNSISEEIFRLQGSNRELRKLIGQDPDGKPLPVEVKEPARKIPSKKKDN